MTRSQRWLWRVAAWMVASSLAVNLAIADWHSSTATAEPFPPGEERYSADVSALYKGPAANFRRDAHGLRGRYESLSTIDILTLGGSTTLDRYVGDGATWPDQLARAFANAGRPMVVVNAGVDGLSADGMLDAFRVWFPTIATLKARYVIVYIGIDDAAATAYGEQAYPQSYRWFTDVSRVRAVGKSKPTLPVVPAWYGARWMWMTPELWTARYPRAHASAMTAYAARVTALAAAIRAFGAQPIFVSQSMGDFRIKGGQVYGVVQDDGITRYGHFIPLMAHNRVMLQACRAAKAVCIDLAAELSFEDGDHYDDLHTTPQGSRKIARYLFEKLKGVVQ